MIQKENLTAEQLAAAVATAKAVAESGDLKEATQKLLTASKGLPTLLDGDELAISEQIARILTFKDDKGKDKDYLAFGADIVRKGKKFRHVDLGVSSFIRGSVYITETAPEPGAVQGTELRPRFTGAEVDFIDFDGVQLPAISEITLKITGKKVFVPSFDEENKGFRKGSNAVWAWAEKDNYGITL